MNGEIEKGIGAVIKALGYMACFLQAERTGKSKE